MLATRPASILSTLTSDPPDVVEVYLALDCAGLERIRATEERTNPGQLTLAALQWGPVFGAGSHDANTLGAQVNGNWGVCDLSRSHIYNALQRNDSPHFLDVAVERRSFESAPGQVFVYVACDHLGWAHSALDANQIWNDTVTLDQHEGIPRPAGRYPHWVFETEKVNAFNPVVHFDKTQFEHGWYSQVPSFVPVDQPPRAGRRCLSCAVGPERHTSTQLIEDSAFSFGGRSYVYDITMIAAVEDGTATFPGAVPPITAGSPWPLTWTAPARLTDALPITNVRAMDIEVFDAAVNPRVDVYVGVPEFGIYCLTVRPSGPSAAWSFDASQQVFIETPGDIHDLKVRPATASGVPRTLLVSDGPAGFRMYGE